MNIGFGQDYLALLLEETLGLHPPEFTAMSYAIQLKTKDEEHRAIGGSMVVL